MGFLANYKCSSILTQFESSLECKILIPNEIIFFFLVVKFEIAPLKFEFIFILQPLKFKILNWTILLVKCPLSAI